MRRERIIIKLGDSIEILNESMDYLSIDEMQDFLIKSKENGATHIELFCDICDGCVDSADMQAVKISEESDEDYNQRLKKEKAEYERLKKIFEVK